MIAVISGFLSSLGYLNVFAVYFLVLVGDVVGDSIYYAIGRWGREGFVRRWGRYIGLNQERTEHLEGHFKKHSGKTLIIGKWSHAVGVVVLVAAGIAEMPFWRFVWFNLVASMPKSLIFVVVGFYFGHAYSQISRYLDYAAITMIVLAGLAIGIYMMVKKIARRYEEKDMDDNNNLG